MRVCVQCRRTKFCVTRHRWTRCRRVLVRKITSAWEDGQHEKHCKSSPTSNTVSLIKRHRVFYAKSHFIEFSLYLVLTCVSFCSALNRFRKIDSVMKGLMGQCPPSRIFGLERHVIKLSRFAVAGAVLAIELLAACQAMEFLRPLTTTAPLEAAYRLVRANIP